MFEIDILKKLESLSENELINEVIVPLLQSMGFQNVQETMGSFEKGRDIICWHKNPFNEIEAYAFQVKKVNFKRSSSKSHTFQQLLNQLKQAQHEMIPNIDGTMLKPDKVFFITPYTANAETIGQNAQLLQELKAMGVTLIDGPSLTQLLKGYLPSLTTRLSGEVGAIKRKTTKDKSEIPIKGLEGISKLDSLSDNGAQALDQLASMHQDLKSFFGNEEPINPKLCFIIMSFSKDPQLEDFYNLGVKKAIEDSGYDCIRIDEQHFNGSILDQVLKNIRLARFVVADLSEARPNCYYELGVAHSLKKEVFHITNSEQDIHFDVKDFNFIVYQRIPELYKALKDRIEKTIGSYQDNTN